MKPILLIKLGGSVITDKNIQYKANIETIKRLAKELKKSKQPIVLAHGSGSFGHPSAVRFGGKKGYKSKEGISKVARDAMEINRIVMDVLIEENLPVISFRPMSMLLAENGKIKENFFEVVEQTILQGLIPVVYGDVIIDRKWKTTICSGEKTLNNIGIYLMNKGYKIDRIIQAGETDGLYNSKKKTILEISRKNWNKVKKFIYYTGRSDVTGEMTHKIEDAFTMAERGIKTYLVNGNRKKELEKAISGMPTKGTLIS
jgi:isopentenyl phosphate kinase